jgi:CRP/FNR family transcriptional regulator
MDDTISPTTAICQSSRTGEFFNSLTTEAQRDFESIATLFSHPSDTRLFAEQQMPLNIFIPYDGEVKLFTNSTDSKRFILRIARPGEVLGLSSAFTGNPYPVTAETLHSCVVASVRRSDFLDFLERYPAAYQGVARELSLHQDQACARLRTIGLTHCTSAKLGRLLLEWCANSQQTELGVRIHVALTHGEIAECIGASRETVTRVLSDFRRRQIVDVHGAILTIKDRSALESCSAI